MTDFTWPIDRPEQADLELVAAHRMYDIHKMTDAQIYYMWIGMTDAEKTGWRIGLPAKPLTQESRYMPALAFLDLFTPMELESVYSAAIHDMQVAVWRDRVRISIPNIELGAQWNVAGLNQIAAKGYVSSARVAEILGGVAGP